MPSARLRLDLVLLLPRRLLEPALLALPQQLHPLLELAPVLLVQRDPAEPRRQIQIGQIHDLVRGGVIVHLEGPRFGAASAGGVGSNVRQPSFSTNTSTHEWASPWRTA